MKIHLIKNLPKQCYLAFSGGIDSMVLLHTLLRRKYEVTLLNVHHLNGFAELEKQFTIETAMSNNLSYIIKYIDPISSKVSKEAHWSNERNTIFQSLDKPVFTAHHLDDCVESYVMTSMQGCSKLILPNNKNIFRPMILTPKRNIIDYANRNRLIHLSDPDNDDSNACLRNKVRHTLIGNIKECFPGINTTVKKLLIKKMELTDNVKNKRI